MSKSRNILLRRRASSKRLPSRKAFRHASRMTHPECQKRYYIENREKIIEKVKEYNEKNKEEKLAYQKQYHKENREKILAYAREYYKKKKEQDPSYSKNGSSRPPKPRRIKKPKESKKPKLQPEPRKPKYEFKEASFIVSLD
jgi:hypothetical protein